MFATVVGAWEGSLSRRRLKSLRFGHRSRRSPEKIARHPGMPVLVRFDWAGGNRMRFFFMSAKRFLVVTALLFFACHSLCAQTNNGGITGSILDSSGAAIADAKVVATGVETHTIYTTTSTASGAYRFGNLVLGAYDITVTAKGFKTAEVTGVVVQINTVASLDITLQPGEVKETLTVVADAPRIQTE